MSFPLNGRIAIVENDINEALPLFESFAKNNIPYVFYKGDDIKYLPEEDCTKNDIRILFLDLNLIGENPGANKDVKSTLYGVLKRIISPKNYPYALIYWSKQVEDYNEIIQDLFNGDLKDRKPICIEPFVKHIFFPTTKGDRTEELPDIFQKTLEVLHKHPAFSYLLHWENQIHNSADKTLEETFNFSNSTNSWEEDANFVFNKLGKSYAGKHFDDTSTTVQDKINSSLHALNHVFLDTLEYNINNNSTSNAQILITSPTNSQVSIEKINSSLLKIDDKKDNKYPGAIIEIETEDKNILDFLIFPQIKKHVYSEENITPATEMTDLLKKEIDKKISKKKKAIKGLISKLQKNIIINVTPLCDYVQNKQKFDRLIKGILIESKYKEYFDDKSEAIFLSPNFQYNDNIYFLVLDFRYFHTTNLENTPKPIFRVRQNMLSEIQSKLARHINRQGILFLD